MSASKSSNNMRNKLFLIPWIWDGGVKVRTKTLNLIEKYVHGVNLIHILAL